MRRQSKRKWAVLLGGENLSMQDLISYARMAQDAGADSIWSCELWRDGFVPLAAMAAAAPNLRVGTGVAHFARPPMLTEMSAMSMAEYTQGKFVLGLGTAPKVWNENWHGMEYRKPVTRMREYIECIRTMWMSTPTRPVSYNGEFYNIKDYRRFIPAAYDRIPIFLAAVQPGMLKLAGTHADGIIVNTLNTVKYLTEVVHPNLKRGLDSSGRSLEDVEICAIKCCAVNKDARQARQLSRHIIAFYATLPYFDIVLDPMGFTEAKLAIQDAMSRGDIPAMLAAVTEEMIDALVLAGTPDDVRRQLRAFDGLFETTLLFCPFFAVEPDVTRANHEAMIEAFAE